MQLGADLARALDPIRFALDCSIDPDPWQRDLLTSTTSRAALLCTRQAGKTTVTALIALHCALYQPGSLIIIVSPSQAQSDEMLRSIKALHSMLDGVPDAIGDSVRKFELTNGSRILALPGTAATIRGYAAPALVIVDEAAGVSDELIQAVFPMLATRADGRFIMLTTPKGKRGFFYNTWVNADPAWKRIKITAKDCPRIAQSFLDEQLRLLGPTRYAEEYNCEFLDSDNSAFPTDIIDRAFTTEIAPLWQ